MPSPDNLRMHNMGTIFGDREAKTFDPNFIPKAEVSLVNEVMALRAEIAALREELKPLPSLIVTGREALDEFKKLTGKN